MKLPRLQAARLQQVAVAPFTGAGIETTLDCNAADVVSLPPSRGQELKRILCMTKDLLKAVAPFTGAGIETTSTNPHSGFSFRVAPFTGAGIETHRRATPQRAATVAPFTGAGIETVAGRSTHPGRDRCPLHGGRN